MKTCSKCAVEKSLDEFRRDTRYLTGHVSWCKECTKEQTREYRRNSQKYKEARKKRDADRAVGNKAVVKDWLQSHPCVDCGEEDWVVLTFDHVRGEKKYNIAQLVQAQMGNSLKLLVEEMMKCDVRCANCHMRVTYARAGSWRSEEAS